MKGRAEVRAGTRFGAVPVAVAAVIAAVIAEIVVAAGGLAAAPAGTGAGAGAGATLAATSAPAASPAAAVSPAAAALPAAHGLIWSHSATDLENLARASLPLRFDMGGKMAGQALLVQDVRDLKTEANRVRLHISGRIDPLGLPLEADPVLTLRFDAMKGAHMVAVESLNLTLGPLGRIDVGRLLGPWEIQPDQSYVIPVRGGAGIGLKATLRRIDLSARGLRIEADAVYFPPPTKQ
jgi:hypothetical protein